MSYNSFYYSVTSNEHKFINNLINILYFKFGKGVTGIMVVTIKKHLIIKPLFKTSKFQS